MSKVSKKEIGRCFKLILKNLETSVELITSSDFMCRFCSMLGKIASYITCTHRLFSTDNPDSFRLQ